MAPNLSSPDRAIRALVGGGLIVVGVLRGVPSVDLLILGVLGLVILATAVTGADPLYRIYGISTLGGLRRSSCDVHGQGCRPELHRRR